LARTGSLSRIPTWFLRVLPKARTPAIGARIFDVAIHQIRAAKGDANAPRALPSRTPLPSGLGVDDLTILTARIFRAA
jgi:hypothetical protein